jgi:hypothetical protein
VLIRPSSRSILERIACSSAVTPLAREELAQLRVRRDKVVDLRLQSHIRLYGADGLLHEGAVVLELAWSGTAKLPITKSVTSLKV